MRCLVLCAVLVLGAVGPQAGGAMVPVPGGSYRSFYAEPGGAPIEVPAFWIDELPVTNADFLAFVESHPRWRRSQAPRIFAEPSYLSHWRGDLEPEEADRQRPVTFVSWFAASAYCRSLGKRLPSEAEWELAAAPPEEDAAARAETRRRILAFYARPRHTLPEVGSTPANAFGVRDLHGVQWEWVADWNASLPAAEGRRAGDSADDVYCGGAAAGAADPSDYAAFMRFAFRSSLEGRHALHHLGFRCARSSPP
jgi:formylglycine-generating enzyme required for sulfatase activity